MIARLELEEVEYLIDLVIYHQHTYKFIRNLGMAIPRPNRLSESTLLALQAAKNSKYEPSAPLTAAEMYPGQYKPGCTECYGMGCGACALPYIEEEK